MLIAGIDCLLLPNLLVALRVLQEVNNNYKSSNVSLRQGPETYRTLIASTPTEGIVLMHAILQVTLQQPQLC